MNATHAEIYRLYMTTCLHHTDAERLAIRCPVCLAAERDAALADRLPFAEAYCDVWRACAGKLAEHVHELAALHEWKRNSGVRNSREIAEIDASLAEYDRLKGTHET